MVGVIILLNVIRMENKNKLRGHCINKGLMEKLCISDNCKSLSILCYDLQCECYSKHSKCQSIIDSKILADKIIVRKGLIDPLEEKMLGNI